MLDLFDPKVWGILIGLAVITERAVEFFVKPFFKRYSWDTFWLLPISWVFGGLVTGLTGLNLFPGLFMWDAVGIVLTAIMVGGGSNFMHEILALLGALKEMTRSRNGG